MRRTKRTAQYGYSPWLICIPGELLLSRARFRFQMASQNYLLNCIFTTCPKKGEVTLKKYKNKRGDFVDALFNIINRDNSSQRLDDAIKLTK